MNSVVLGLQTIIDANASVKQRSDSPNIHRHEMGQGSCVQFVLHSSSRYLSQEDQTSNKIPRSLLSHQRPTTITSTEP